MNDKSFLEASLDLFNFYPISFSSNLNNSTIKDNTTIDKKNYIEIDH